LNRNHQQRNATHILFLSSLFSIAQRTVAVLLIRCWFFFLVRALAFAVTWRVGFFSLQEQKRELRRRKLRLTRYRS